MNTTNLLLFPGNPGSAEDFAALLAALGPLAQLPRAVYQMPARSRSLADMFAAADAAYAQLPSGGGTLLIAYSFGAYVALKWAQARGYTWSAVVLINPTLLNAQPVSFGQRAVARLPGVRNLLLSKLAPKLAAAFVANCFAPAKPEAQLAAAMIARLQRGAVWEAALCQKVVAQAAPLQGDLGALSRQWLVLRGAVDQAVPWALQEALLTKLALPAPHVHALAGAGHALLWTHPVEVASMIRARA